MQQYCLREVIEKLIKKEKVYIAKAPWQQYIGGGSVKETQHYILTEKSAPIVSLSIDENIARNRVKLLDESDLLFKKEVITKTDLENAKKEGFIVYVSDKKFRVWIHYRGDNGKRNEDFDSIIDAYELKSIDRLIESIQKAKFSL